MNKYKVFIIFALVLFPIGCDGCVPNNQSLDIDIQKELSPIKLDIVYLKAREPNTKIIKTYSSGEDNSSKIDTNNFATCDYTDEKFDKIKCDFGEQFNEIKKKLADLDKTNDTSLPLTPNTNNENILERSFSEESEIKTPYFEEKINNFVPKNYFEIEEKIKKIEDKLKKLNDTYINYNSNNANPGDGHITVINNNITNLQKDLENLKNENNKKIKENDDKLNELNQKIKSLEEKGFIKNENDKNKKISDLENNLNELKNNFEERVKKVSLEVRQKIITEHGDLNKKFEDLEKQNKDYRITNKLILQVSNFFNEVNKLCFAEALNIKEQARLNLLKIMDDIKVRIIDYLTNPTGKNTQDFAGLAYEIYGKSMNYDASEKKYKCRIDELEKLFDSTFGSYTITQANTFRNLLNNIHVQTDYETAVYKDINEIIEYLKVKKELYY